MSKIRVIGNKLVPVYETDTGKKFVYAVLEVKSNYTTWINRRFNECDAIENEDYQTCFPKLESENHGGQNKKEHIIKLDTAKEMAMLERNDIGKQVRKYFIEIEKEYKQTKVDHQQLLPIYDVPFNEVVKTLPVFADFLKVNTCIQHFVFL